MWGQHFGNSSENIFNIQCSSNNFLYIFNSSWIIPNSNGSEFMISLEDAKKRMEKDAWAFAEQIEPVYEMMNYKTITPRGHTVPITLEIYMKLTHLIKQLDESGALSSAYLTVFYDCEEISPRDYGMMMHITKSYSEAEDEDIE